MSSVNGRMPLRWQSVADDLAGRISAGDFPEREDGHRWLPSEKALCQEYEVSDTTVRHALQALRDQGTCITERGIGTRVRTTADDSE